MERSDWLMRNEKRGHHFDNFDIGKFTHFEFVPLMGVPGNFQQDKGRPSEVPEKKYTMPWIELTAWKVERIRPPVIVFLGRMVSLCLQRIARGERAVNVWISVQ
jgi:hypothetical protein